MTISRKTSCLEERDLRKEEQKKYQEKEKEGDCERERGWAAFVRARPPGPWPSACRNTLPPPAGPSIPEGTSAPGWIPCTLLLLIIPQRRHLSPLHKHPPSTLPALVSRPSLSPWTSCLGALVPFLAFIHLCGQSPGLHLGKFLQDPAESSENIPHPIFFHDHIFAQWCTDLRDPDSSPHTPAPIHCPPSNLQVFRNLLVIKPFHQSIFGTSLGHGVILTPLLSLHHALLLLSELVFLWPSPLVFLFHVLQYPNG